MQTARHPAKEKRNRVKPPEKFRFSEDEDSSSDYHVILKKRNKCCGKCCGRNRK